MLYYSHKARNSAINAINDCIQKISKIKGTELSYLDATQTIRFLSILKDEIVREDNEVEGER